MWDGVASVSQRTPAVSSVEGQAVSAVVVGGATVRDSNAVVSRSTPSIASSANALTGDAVMVVGACGGNVVTGVGSGAPGSSGVE